MRIYFISCDFVSVDDKKKKICHMKIVYDN